MINKQSTLTGRADFDFRLRHSNYWLMIAPDYCVAVARALEPEPGETWLRSEVILDGDLSALPEVLLAVIDYELALAGWTEEDAE